MKKTFNIQNVGCLRRMLDCQRHEDLLIKNGWKKVIRIEDACLIIISTCSYSDEKEDYTIDILLEIKKRITKGSQLVITGCSAVFKNALNSNNISDDDIKIIKSEEELESIIESEISMNEIPDCNHFKLRPFSLRYSFKRIFNPFDTPAKYRGFHIFLSMLNKSFFPKKYFFLRVSNGCLGECSYCIIKKSIGSLKSKSADTVLKEYEKGVGSGYKEFVLLGDDTGAYGTDIGTNLTELIHKMMKKNDNHKFHIIELNINWYIKMKDEFNKLIDSGKIKGIHFCVQSGNQKILKLMNRYSDIEKIRESLISLNKKHPGLRKSIDLIAGFPGETYDDFQDSVNLAKDAGFNDVWLFPYSERKGTPATMLKGKIEKEVIQERVKFFYQKVKCSNSYFPFFR